MHTPVITNKALYRLILLFPIWLSLILSGCGALVRKATNYAYKAQPLKEHMIPGITQSFSIWDACPATGVGKLDIVISPCTTEYIDLKVTTSNPKVVQLLTNVAGVVKKQKPGQPLRLDFKGLKPGNSIVTITANNQHNTKVFRYNMQVQTPTAIKPRFKHCVNNVFERNEKLYFHVAYYAGDQLLDGTDLKYISADNATLVSDGMIKLGPNLGPFTIRDTMANKVVLHGDIIPVDAITAIEIRQDPVHTYIKRKKRDVYYFDISEKAGNRYVCRNIPPFNLKFRSPQSCGRAFGNYKNYVIPAKRITPRGYRYEIWVTPHSSCTFSVTNNTAKSLRKEYHFLSH